ncbi:hypothetical protein TEQG_01447 [Trichophyton equinum CBS 127.97]|uniref:Uncharacterized protein n=1 Tax=Trichophyton equinum (strain ATCC MYA-4606 / CBS 127.97) TaxID=559882 RepID=F2PKJ2_TRIEC|nr:hypothetical protein TEQG_01447 [Trichophyton equinum CBS 127.97]
MYKIDERPPTTQPAANEQGQARSGRIRAELQKLPPAYVTGTPHVQVTRPLRTHLDSVKKALASAYPWYGAVPGCPSRFRRDHTLPYLLRITPTKNQQNMHGGFFFCSLSLHHRDGLFGGRSLILTERWQAGLHRVPISTQMARWRDDKSFETSPPAPLDGGDKPTPSKSPGIAGKRPKGLDAIIHPITVDLSTPLPSATPTLLLSMGGSSCCKKNDNRPTGFSRHSHEPIWRHFTPSTTKEESEFVFFLLLSMPS